jgi:hypothetical protein
MFGEIGSCVADFDELRVWTEIMSQFSEKIGLLI